MRWLFPVFAGCADTVWDYRQMSCEQVDRIELRDGPGKPLVVRSTCPDVADETCELKLTGLRGGAYHHDGGDVLYAHEVREVELEATAPPNAVIDLAWGEGGAPDVALGRLVRGLQVVDGTRGSAVVQPEGGIAFECDGCDAVVVSTEGSFTLDGAAHLQLCVNASTADLTITIDDDQVQVEVLVVAPSPEVRVTVEGFERLEGTGFVVRIPEQTPLLSRPNVRGDEGVPILPDASLTLGSTCASLLAESNLCPTL
jgi:hypothetical protein